MEWEDSGTIGNKNWFSGNRQSSLVQFWQRIWMLPLHLECERDSEIDKICQLESRSLRWVPWHAYAYRTRSLPPPTETSTSNPASFADFDGIPFTLQRGFSCWEDYCSDYRVLLWLVSWLLVYHCFSSQSLAQNNMYVDYSGTNMQLTKQHFPPIIFNTILPSSRHKHSHNILWLYLDTVEIEGGHWWESRVDGARHGFLRAMQLW